MARPRSIESQDIIAIGYELLFEVGLSGLTFEALASRVGLVPAALVKRFGSKRQLLIEIDRYALAQTNAKVKQAIDASLSPIDAIIAQFTTEMSFVKNARTLANGMEFLALDFRDKDLYDNYALSFKHRHEQIVVLLRDAQQKGELTGVMDFDTLARHLELLLHGAAHVWVMTQSDTLARMIEIHVETALKPYLPRG